MKKFFRRVVKTFKKFADANFLAFGNNVTVSMAAAVDIFPNPNPSLADINTVLGNFADVIQAAASRDKVQVELKKQIRFNLSQMLSQLADYVNATTTDPALLIRSGYDLNKLPAPVELEAPTRLVLTDGPNSGELILKFKNARGASSYLHQYTTDALLPEDSWVSIPSTVTTHTFKGLIKGVTYYVRAVSVGRKQQLIKSIVVNRVSQ